MARLFTVVWTEYKALAGGTAAGTVLLILGLIGGDKNWWIGAAVALTCSIITAYRVGATIAEENAAARLVMISSIVASRPFAISTARRTRGVNIVIGACAVVVCFLVGIWKLHPSSASSAPTIVGEILSAELLRAGNDQATNIWALVSIPSGGNARSQISAIKVTLTVAGVEIEGKARIFDGAFDVKCPGGVMIRFSRSDFLYYRFLDPGAVTQAIIVYRFPGVERSDVDFTTLRIYFTESYGHHYLMTPIKSPRGNEGLPCGVTPGIGTVIRG